VGLKKVRPGTWLTLVVVLVLGLVSYFALPEGGSHDIRLSLAAACLAAGLLGFELRGNKVRKSGTGSSDQPQASKGHWWTEPDRFFRVLSKIVLSLVMVGLLVVSGWVLVHTFLEPFNVFVGQHDFATLLADVINGALLIVILIEIVEAIREQIVHRERLRPRLVRNLLVIGIVSAVRHLLTAGAELSLIKPTDHAHLGLLQEVAVNAVVVILLTGVWVLTFKLTRTVGEIQEEEKPDDVGVKTWSDLLFRS
jgi:hypothetical protein